MSGTTTTVTATTGATSAETDSGGATTSVEEATLLTLQGVVYTSVTLEECEYDPSTRTFYYICPCGDVFELLLEDVKRGKLDAECPSCSLHIRLTLKPGELDSYT